MESNRTIILIPTYNEIENIEEILERILSLKLDADILFVDDNSPDGTGEKLEILAKKSPNIFVLHRTGKLGIGSAHQEGIKWSYQRNYAILITIDCDLTHPPESIPELIKYSADYDVVIGSRYMMLNSLKEWNVFRKTLTIFGHFMTSRLLKMKYDATGAFRLYNIDRIPYDVFTLVSSHGYSFFYESLYILNINKFTIKEIPIRLPARTYGHSKMKLGDIWHSFIFLFSIYLNALLNKEKYEVYEQFVPDNNVNSTCLNNNEWDEYWKNQKSTGGLFYDAIASFYRKYIIKRALNYFVKKHFAPQSRILHAGAGSGQVDEDIRDLVCITALDYSVNALSIYKKVNKDKCKLLCGSILDIPLPDDSVDGIYNLGVMEHFTEEEIKIILSEFRRVLKPGGKIILFWPPEFGLSVIVMKGIHYILNNILKKNVKLHPDEISRVKSKEEIKRVLKTANIELVDFYFGIKDFFTHAVIVGKK